VSLIEQDQTLISFVGGLDLPVSIASERMSEDQ
jgi:hypothetical protein